MPAMIGAACWAAAIAASTSCSRAVGRAPIVSPLYLFVTSRVGPAATHCPSMKRPLSLTLNISVAPNLGLRPLQRLGENLQPFPDLSLAHHKRWDEAHR